MYGAPDPMYGRAHDPYSTNQLADALFSGAPEAMPPPPTYSLTTQLAPPPPQEAPGTAAHTVRRAFAPSETQRAALVHPLAGGDTLHCTPEKWRLGVDASGLWTWAPDAQLEEAPPVDARHKIVLELIDTEETYGTAMGLICETVIAPLTRAGILTAPTIARVFSSTDRLWKASKELSEALRARLADGWDAERTRVGDALIHVLNADAGMLGQSKARGAGVGSPLATLHCHCSRIASHGCDSLRTPTSSTSTASTRPSARCDRSTTSPSGSTS